MTELIEAEFSYLLMLQSVVSHIMQPLVDVTPHLRENESENSKPCINIIWNYF